MQLNLIMDGNFLLSKLVFTLHKNNLLFGALYNSLENTVSNYKKWYPFANIYLVSDSREKSWRKRLLNNYKSNRKKDSDIDWSFVYKTYEEFKSNLKGARILEAPEIEGDDWISLVINESNKKGQSNIVISNDHDIKQLITFSLDPLWINFMTNEMYNQEKIFLPHNYKLFLDRVKSISNNDDIFSLNDNSDFVVLFDRFTQKYNISEIDPLESLIIKVISGDSSDNISSVFQVSKNGKVRGIGIKGAQSIYEDYFSEFGDPSLSDPDLYENIADIICEKKKLSKSNIENIVTRIRENMSLVDLRIESLPQNIVDKMKLVYGRV
jgi:5'-3' exonuclease